MKNETQWTCSPDRDQRIRDEHKRLEIERKGNANYYDQAVGHSGDKNSAKNSNNQRNNYNDYLEESNGKQRRDSVSRDRQYAPKDYYIQGKLDDQGKEIFCRSGSKDCKYDRNGSVLNRSRSRSIAGDDNMSQNGSNVIGRRRSINGRSLGDNVNIAANSEMSKSRDKYKIDNKAVKTNAYKNKVLYHTEIARSAKFKDNIPIFDKITTIVRKADDIDIDMEDIDLPNRRNNTDVPT